MYVRDQYWIHILFKLFLNDLEDGEECTLKRFAEGGVADIPGSRVIVQKGLDR